MKAESTIPPRTDLSVVDGFNYILNGHKVGLYSTRFFNVRI
jgi:hypothetical protein